ncbi:MAG: NUDIX hydrolase [Acetatifactor sp.]|nr:NUDIX hydrolase [Acetatifactor sp.]
MQGYNVIAVFSENVDKVLMCKRRKNPYKGLSNFVGGKIEDNENGLDAAYRELEEETAITKNDIILSNLMDFTYYLQNCYLEVYVGKLNKTIDICGDENELYWSALDKDFFDVTQYAGEGNIGHIMMHIEMFREELLNADSL